MMLILGLSVQLTSQIALGAADSLGGAIGSAVPGIMLILVSCVAPLALFKLLAFVDPGTSSGAAMRAGLAASGGMQGLLNGGGGGEATPRPRVTRAAPPRGGILRGRDLPAVRRGCRGCRGNVPAGSGSAAATGLGAFANAGGRAAAVGADLTNQMGVGHNTYIPDFASSRSAEQQRRSQRPRQPRDQRLRPRSRQRQPRWPLPSPPAPSMPSSSGLPAQGCPVVGGLAPPPAPALRAGGGAAAGGAGAAAAVPVVPV